MARQPYRTHVRRLLLWKTLDEIFKNNFVQYADLIGRNVLNEVLPITDDMFTDEDVAIDWLKEHMGMINVEQIGPQPGMKHCKFQACLASPYLPEPMYTRAPTELHATLLAAVNVFRELSQSYIDRRMVGRNH